MKFFPSIPHKMTYIIWTFSILLLLIDIILVSVQITSPNIIIPIQNISYIIGIACLLYLIYKGDKVSRILTFTIIGMIFAIVLWALMPYYGTPMPSS